MKRDHQGRIVVIAILAALQLSACAPATRPNAAGKNQPARIEKVDGSSISRVILTTEAAKRLDIKTESVRNMDDGGRQRSVMPYAAVVYDLKGDTWAYTSPEPLTFVRKSVTVDSIAGDTAFLSEGPPSGTQVVTVGVAELFGAEFGIGK
jgi:hypothetical protein